MSEDSGVGLNMVGRMVFSEPIDPLSVQHTDLPLSNADGGSPLDARSSSLPTGAASR